MLPIEPLSSRAEELSSLGSKQPLIMGILNITPDSFSDGGKFLTYDEAILHAQKMFAEGADIIDIGGESSRPGSIPISAQEELDRIMPIIETLQKEMSIPISVDTYKFEVIKEVAKVGVKIINDITALSDESALSIIKKNNLTVCLMHMQNTPQNMQQNPYYKNVVHEVYNFLEQRINLCLKAGITKDKIIIDPGFGFGKTVKHNCQIINNLENFKNLGCKILIGVSRKSTLGAILNAPLEERLYGSLAATTLAVYKGANIIRTHDVKATSAAVRVTAAIMSTDLKLS